jgi:ATP-binding cassette, subfamily B, bacterial PglK
MESLKKVNSLFDHNQKKKLYLLLFVIFFVSILDLIGISAILPVLIVFSDPKFIENDFIILILNKIGFLDETNFLFYAIIFLFLIFVFKVFSSLILNFIKYKILLSFYSQISNKLMGNYIKVSYSEFIKLRIFEKSNVIKTEIEYFILGVIDPILIISLELLTIILISAFLLFYDASLLIKFFLFGFFITILLTYLFSKKLKIIGNEKLLLNNLLQKQIFQGFQGIKDIKLAVKENLFLSKYELITKKMSNVLASTKSLQEAPRLLIELLAITCFIFIIIMGLDNQEEFSSLIVKLGIFAAGAFRILPSLNRIVVSVNSIKQCHSVINVIYNDYQLKNKIKINFYEQNNFEKIKNIEIKNLKYKYIDSQDLIIDNLNLKISAGDYIGIFGKSGCGKSTFVDLFSGLLTPNDGNIVCNNKDISSIKTIWKKKIGYVPQSIYLNNETIKENVAFGEKFENINEKKVLESIKKSSLDDYVKSLPEGINAIVGENGVNLSGGQIQRLGIARALYRDPEILIFDESTNSLDAETEDKFMKVVSRIKDNKIVIFISHQKKILSECNKIYEFQNKKLLMKNN